MIFRLIESPANAGAANMALDEAILMSVAAGHSPPTLRLYTWAPPCLTIGYFQSLDAEVDVAACKAAGVDVVRRITGGGAVYHDRELTYSVILPEKHELALADILASYGAISASIIRALAALGLDAEHSGINDIVCRGKKISGNAQTRRSHGVLQHGTILLDLDRPMMFRLLKVPLAKLADKGLEVASSRVSSVSELLSRKVGVAEMSRAMIDACRETWRSEFASGEVTELERTTALELMHSRFANAEWTRRR